MGAGWKLLIKDSIRNRLFNSAESKENLLLYLCEKSLQLSQEMGQPSRGGSVQGLKPDSLCFGLCHSLAGRLCGCEVTSQSLSFPNLQSEDDNATYFVGLLGGDSYIGIYVNRWYSTWYGVSA